MDLDELMRLHAERDTLQNKVYDLEHVIQHWEVDAEGLKDDLNELHAAADKLVQLCDASEAAGEWTQETDDAREELRTVLAHLKLCAAYESESVPKAAAVDTPQESK